MIIFSATSHLIYFVLQERERMFEHDLRRVKGLEIRKMAEDGNCLFRAVADQVYGDAEAYDMARQMCVDYMVGFFFASSSNLLVYILLGQSFAYPVLLINKFNYQSSPIFCKPS